VLYGLDQLLTYGYTQTRVALKQGVPLCAGFVHTHWMEMRYRSLSVSTYCLRFVVNKDGRCLGILADLLIKRVGA
jgi:hypothetical protein